jgi:hypothetical protein
MTIEYKNFAAHVKGYDPDELWVDHFISVQVPDRSGDLLYADGMRIFGRPVTMFAHGKDPRYGAEPIARPLWIRPGTFKGYPGIEARTKFFDDDIGKRLWRKTVEGFCPSWSIGFIPIRWTYIDGGPGRSITEYEILEYSLVPVPANALAQTPEYKALGFKFVEDGHKCDCGANLCQKSDGTFFECRHRQPIKIKIPDDLINRLTKEAVRKELDSLRSKIS